MKEESEERILTEKARMMSPTIMAYVGDAEYELFVRDHVVKNYAVQVKKMHNMCVRFVSSHAQSEILRQLSDELTEEEADIVRRARNIRTTSMPKNADVMEYKYATAFEALVGYLHLSEQNERLKFLYKRVVEIVEGD